MPTHHSRGIDLNGDPEALKQALLALPAQEIADMLRSLVTIPGSPRGLRQSAIAFCRMHDPGYFGRRELMAHPQALFKGQGLWLWGADETTLVHNIKAGNQTCYALSTVAIPGLFFEAGMSFEEFEKLLDAPREEWSQAWLRELPPIDPHQEIHMLATEIGNTVSLDVEGPLTHAVMWGKTVV